LESLEGVIVTRVLVLIPIGSQSTIYVVSDSVIFDLIVTVSHIWKT